MSTWADAVVGRQRGLFWGFFGCGIGLAFGLAAIQAALLGPPGAVGWAGWGLWLLLLCDIAVGIGMAGGRLPAGMAMAAAVFGLAIVVLDLLSTGLVPGVPHQGGARALIATGGLVAACVPLRPSRELKPATVAFAAALVASELLRGGWRAELILPSVAIVVVAAGPGLAFAWCLDAVQRLVRDDAERARLRTMARSPADGLGARAGEQLVSLDLRAEKLLEEVGSGQRPLPLGAADAALAGRLADELRRRLTEERSGTWLRHALEESRRLRRSVIVSDPDGLAARLSEPQREALLTTTWLLLGDSARTAQRLRIAFQGAPDAADLGVDELRVSFTSSGIPFARVDGSVWDVLSTLGAVESRRAGSSFRATVRAATGNPGGPRGGSSRRPATPAPARLPGDPRARQARDE